MTDSVPLCSPEQVAFVRKQLGTNEEDIRQALKMLRDWLEKQPHLPDEIDDGRLERMYINCKCRLEKVKTGLDAYFSLKNRYPELLMNRDPLHPDIEWVKNHQKLATLPQLTQEGYRVHIHTVYGLNAEDFRFASYLQLTLMEMEVLLAEDYSVGDVFIIDLADLGMGHILRMEPGLVRASETTFRTAYCRKMTGLHLVNASKVTDAIMKLLKSVLPSKLHQRIFVHLPGSTTLFDHVPRNLVPDELGGTAGTVDRFNHLLYERVCKYRSWFLEQDKYVSNESRRPSEGAPEYGLEGSFRKLVVD